MLPTSPRLRRILAAYTVNKLGTWFGTVALSLAIYDHTHSAAAVTALFVARYLPALAVPALVARMEASTAPTSLSALYVFEAACAVLLAALVWHFLLAAILVLVALDGAVELTASSLLRAQAARAGRGAERRAGHLRRQRGAERRDVGLGRDRAGARRARRAGLRGPVALLIDAGSFLACAALVVNLYVYVEERAGASVRARLASAWEHVRDAPALRAVLLTQAAALVFFETAAPVEVFYAKGTLRAGDVGYGVAAGGLGRGPARRQPPVRARRATLAGGDADARHARRGARLPWLRGGAHAGARGARRAARRRRQRRAMGLAARHRATAHARAAARAADGRRGIDRRPLPPDRAALEPGW